LIHSDYSFVCVV